MIIGMLVKITTSIHPINVLIIHGTLEIADGQDLVISATHIIINGGTLKTGGNVPRRNQLTIKIRDSTKYKNVTKDLMIPPNSIGKDKKQLC